MLWHPPSEAVRVPGIVRAPTTSGLLPPELERARGVLLGIFHGRGRDVPVHLPRRDLEAGHAIVIGRTGVGKSTLLHQVNRGFLAAPDQPAVAVIDPHGDLVADLAAQSLPSSREDQTVILDLGDIEFPVGIPLFAGPAGVTQEELIQRTFGVFKLIFREVWSPTRMEDAIFALVATLCAQSRATLLDIAPLLLDPGFRRRAISSVVDSTVREFWSDYEQLSEGGKRELARPILNRTRALYRSSAVRNMLCQERGCDFTDLVDRGGVLLVKLSGAAIQAEADLLGELIIAHLHLALLGRLAQARAQRRAFYLTVDESQRFAGASLPILLREGRKLGVAMMLSTQYLDAWGEELAESVLGNAGMLLAFRSGPADSRRLRASIRPYTTEDLQDLDRYTAIAKLQLDGRTMPAVSLRTLPIEAPPDPAVLARIRSATRVRYARPRREVEADLARPSGPANPRDRMDIDEE